MTSQPGLAPASGARLDQVLARRPRQLVYGGGGPTTRLVCGYLACDSRVAGILLAGLPALLRVNVRGSNAGTWLEASVRYALAEARSLASSRFGQAGRAAVYRSIAPLRVNERREGRTGWLPGAGDRIVGPALNAMRSSSGLWLDVGKSWRTAPEPEVSARGAVSELGRKFPNAVPDAVAHVARRGPAVPEQLAACANRGGRRLSDRHRFHPRVSPRALPPPAAWRRSQLARDQVRADPSRERRVRTPCWSCTHARVDGRSPASCGVPPTGWPTCTCAVH